MLQENDELPRTAGSAREEKHDDGLRYVAG